MDSFRCVQHWYKYRRLYPDPILDWKQLPDATRQAEPAVSRQVKSNLSSHGGKLRCSQLLRKHHNQQHNKQDRMSNDVVVFTKNGTIIYVTKRLSMTRRHSPSPGRRRRSSYSPWSRRRSRTWRFWFDPSSTLLRCLQGAFRKSEKKKIKKDTCWAGVTVWVTCGGEKYLQVGDGGFVSFHPDDALCGQVLLPVRDQERHTDYVSSLHREHQC